MLLETARPRKLELAKAETLQNGLDLFKAELGQIVMESKRAQGVESRKSETGEELMVEYDQLSEAAKSLDRNTVKAVYAAIRALEAEAA